MIDDDFAAFLKADTELNALLGGRIYPLVLDQKVKKPAMVMSMRRYPKLGYNGNGREEVTFQLDVYSNSHPEARAIQNRLIEVLHGFSGELGSTSVILSEIENSFDSFEAKTKLHRVTLDVALIT